MSPSRQLHTLSATQVAALLRKDAITAVEYARALLERIEERDGTVAAWVYLDPKLVLEQAKALDRVPHEQRGPLHGIGVAIKDIMNTQDMPTEFGSAIYKGNRPHLDASPVSILRRAGALILGKTTTTEFTLPNSGPRTSNPHDPKRTPGGSSAGSAAAVADFQVPLSFGTQNNGSVIRPASYTGVFAMKPTFNAISMEGAKQVGFSCDTIGFMARSVADLELVGKVFNLPKVDVTKPLILKGARIAFVKTAFWPKAARATIEAMEKAEQILKRHGVKVEHLDLPPIFADGEAIRRAHKLLLFAEAGTLFLVEYRQDKDRLAEMIRDIVEQSDQFNTEQVLEALDTFAQMRVVFDSFAGDYTAIITPSADDVAPVGLDDMGHSSFNRLWTILHVPLIHVPAFAGEENMPIGLSVVAGRLRDRHLIDICTVLSAPLMAEGGWSPYEHLADIKL